MFSNETAPAAHDPTVDTSEQKFTAKIKFIARLKTFLYEQKGDHIYDHVVMELGHLFFAQLRNGTLQQPVEVPYTLDIDLMQLCFFDQFVAENFTRCIFRYSAHLSEYVRDVFFLRVEDEERTLRAQTTVGAGKTFKL